MTASVLSRLNIFVSQKVVTIPWIKPLLLNEFSVKLRKGIYALFNLFYLPFLYRSYRHEIKKVPDNYQLFFITRHDLGTHLILLHYVNCWEKTRGKTCLVILTSKAAIVTELAKIICPNTLIISPHVDLANVVSLVFGHCCLHYDTMLAVYGRLVIDRPDALFIYENSSMRPTDPLSHVYSNYHPIFDTNLVTAEKKFSTDFCSAYIQARKKLDYRLPLFVDAMNLHYSLNLSTSLISLPSTSQKLKQILGIKRDYVIFNINLKEYSGNYYEYKIIQYPERYNCLIDYLINKGFDVVIQGRSEQPLFAKREGLIDYSRSPYTSIEHDITLYSACHFAIVCKSGPSCFTTICNVPALELNSVEPLCVITNQKLRYYPKHVRDPATGLRLSWQEILKSPCFYNLGGLKCQDVEYSDLTEEEMLQALKEFMPLIPLPPASWLQLTENQKKFKESLHPMHLEAYYAKGVPCDYYLQNEQ